MTPELLRQMTDELKELHDRYVKFLADPFIFDIAQHAFEAAEIDEQALLAPGQHNDEFLKAEAIKLREVAYGSLYAAAYSGAVRRIHGRYQRLDNELEISRRVKGLETQAAEAVGGPVSSSRIDAGASNAVRDSFGLG